MGREIRRVPGDWQHPVWTKDDASRSELVGKLRPLFDQDYETAAEKWLANLDLWRTGKHPDQQGKDRPGYFWDWDGGPPDRDYYRERKWTEAEATHFILYETVSEGTPLTPAFATREELADYLVTHGDAWGKSWSRASADRMVSDGWAPSGIMTGGRFYQSNEIGEIPK